MNLLKKTAAVLPAVAVLALIGGCDSGGARTIDAGGSETIVTIDNIDIQDYLNAVDELTDDLLASGVLVETGADGETFIEIDRVQNDTSRPGVDVEQLTDRMRENVLKSRLAKVLTPRGESVMATDRQSRDRFMGNAEESDYPQPDYFLTGRLSNLAARAGNTRQQTFVFRMSLTDSRGIEQWVNNVNITKQGRRNSVGR